MQAKILEYLEKNKKTRILITKNEKSLEQISHIVSYLGYEAVCLSDFRAYYMDDLRSYKNEIIQINSSLKKFYNNPKSILISPYNTLLHKMPVEKYINDDITIDFADTINLTELKEKLFRWGYEFVDIVECEGEVSFRGDLFDIYPIGVPYPLRVSLFDDKVEEIREFSHITQKTVKKDIESISVSPALFALDEKEFVLLNEQIEINPSNIINKDIHSLGLWLLEEKIFLSDEYESVHVEDLAQEFEENRQFNKECSKLSNISVIPQNKNYKDIISADPKTILQLHNNKKITILASNEALLKACDIEEYKKYYIKSNLIVNILKPDEIIISLNTYKKQRKITNKPKILLDDLKINDYVVHEDYGVGRFLGLHKNTILGTTKDYLEIIYQNEDKVLVPIENISLIDRYMSDSGVLATLDKLGRGTFAKLKSKAKAKLLEIAGEIVATAAKRELIQISKIDINQSEIEYFRSLAGFTYTPDQISSCEAIFEDFTKPLIMDRLLSADVGFGKTEIAMNAIFAMVKAGYQVAIVVPTTLLANQHFITIRDRFKHYENLAITQITSKNSIYFDTNSKTIIKKTKPQIIKDIKDGEANIVIGTHSLFNLEFHNLLLLVIDEEHKFGVKQKESLKNLKNNIHILSMSATPIPRSLNLALSKVKQYSIINTAPKNRKNIRTFLKNYDPNSIKEAITRELRRNGQVFYLHNRIASIAQKHSELQRLLPDIRIVTLHSKIPPAKLESEMLKFQNKEYDLLLCTSIIESGIHIPNANTLIIENANTFGMADLHQLRGRVGRSDIQGYCYLLVQNDEELSENSTKRLQSLQNNSYLGSGMALAHHDLEIRGGGNIIGKSQSGHIKNIGYAMYLKMLEDAINELLNTTPTPIQNTSINLSVSSYLNETYIPQDRLRLDLYRRLGQCQNILEVYDIEQEMIDRFGKIDEITNTFLSIIIIKILASKKKIAKLANYKKSITIEYENGDKKYIEASSSDEDDIVNDLMLFLKEKN